MTKQFVLGIYEDEEALVKSASELKKEGIKIFDFYTPFPVHGLDEILEISRSRLPQITFLAGGFGLLLAISFQVWTSAFDWPIDVGGKPMLSIVAFIPITFELMILFGALTTVAAFLFVSNLFPTQEAKIMDIRQTDDHFILAIKSTENALAPEIISAMLEKNGAIKVRLID